MCSFIRDAFLEISSRIMDLDANKELCKVNPPGTKGFGTHTKHQGGESKRTPPPPPVSQEREMLQT